MHRIFGLTPKEEGYMQIAKIFMTTAEQELSHAEIFFSLLEGGTVTIEAGYPAGVVADTATNLREAAAGEREEWSDLYTNFASIAEEEGFPAIAGVWRRIAKVEVAHEKRYIQALEHLTSGMEFSSPEPTEWQCMHCGYVHEGKEAPKKCPVCGKEQGYFERKADNY